MNGLKDVTKIGCVAGMRPPLQQNEVKNVIIVNVEVCWCVEFVSIGPAARTRRK